RVDDDGVVVDTGDRRNPELRAAEVRVPELVDAPAPLDLQRRLAARILRAEHEVAASVVDVAPGERGEAEFLAVPFRGRPHLRIDLEAFEVVLQDEVHDSGHRVRAVDGRRAARDDLDALDRRAGDRVRV